MSETGNKSKTPRRAQDLTATDRAAIIQRLEHAERRLADFALNAIPARLDRLLADFSDRYGVPESPAF